MDSELSCLDLTPWPITGPLSNPYFKRYVTIQDANMPPGLLLVCRLDGPTMESVMAMIDGALAAEKIGLWGWAYVDMRNIQGGGYKEGDDWLREAVSSMRRRGIPVLVDQAPETLPVGFPLTNAAVYYGWYDGNASGPFADTSLRLRQGGDRGAYSILQRRHDEKPDHQLDRPSGHARSRCHCRQCLRTLSFDDHKPRYPPGSAHGRGSPSRRVPTWRFVASRGWE